MATNTYSADIIILQSGVMDKDRPLPKGFNWPNPSCPVAFVDIHGKEVLSQAASYYNMVSVTEYYIHLY